MISLALGGLGFPEVFVILLVPAAYMFILWKFYQAISRIGKELAEIKQVLREGRTPAGSGG